MFGGYGSVSYTHLDVYKRQTLGYEYNEKCEAVPLLEDYEYSSIPEEYKNRLAELNQGAMDFYQSYPLDMMQYGSIDADLVMTNFIQFVLHPDDEDVAYWGPYPVYIDSFEPMVKNKSLAAYLSKMCIRDRYIKIHCALSTLPLKRILMML